MRRSQAQNRTRQYVCELPLTAQAAIYASADTQEVNGLFQLAADFGYTQERITMFLDVVTPETPLAARKGYQSLLHEITAGNISVLFMLDIAGVFAHAAQAERDTFIIAGMSNGLFVVTKEEGIFSFSNLTHIVHFRKLCMSAVEALTSLWNC